VKHIAHLAKRFVSSLSRSEVSETELRMVRATLSTGEFELWCRFANADRRHSVAVVQRFIASRPDASRHEIAGVLLHDIGKIESNLSTIQRVIATIIGPRTKLFALYHQHEEIGMELLRRVGSHNEVIAILNHSCSSDVAEAFRKADNI
jgi:hypothetical protein